MSESLQLWDYRRRVFDIYRQVREGGSGPVTWQRWVSERDTLFREHPQTALESPSTFEGLPYFGYDAKWRTTARFEAAEPSAWGEFSRVGSLSFDLEAGPAALPVFWLEAYGGGIFVPFKDGTSGDSTYGGGRYILDTVKGADLGHEDDQVVLDFNYAYHPSCVHSPRWACPLAPPDSTLPFPVTAGEKLSEGPGHP